MKRPRIRRSLVLVLSLFVLVTAYLGLRLVDRDTGDKFALTVSDTASPHTAVQSAWSRARNAGTYDFTADVVQSTIPVAQVTNIGRASEESRLHIEGATNLPDNQMEMVLWTGGGSVADPQSGIEVKIDGQTAKARRGDGSWQTVDNFGDVFAPQGDFMAYLVAAENVRRAGTETRTVPTAQDGGAGTESSDVTFTRYTFQIDGPRFARYVRDQMQHRLTKQGDLPPNVALQIPDVYAGMTGTGELWVDERGLPLRQILYLQFPKQQDHRVEADVTVHFAFPDDQRTAMGDNGGPSAIVGRLSSVVFGALGAEPVRQSMLASVLGILLLTVILRYRHLEQLYAAFALAIIISMVLTPLLQSHQVVAYSAEQKERQAEQERRQQQYETRRDLRDALTASQWNPHTDPLSAESGQKSAASGQPSAVNERRSHHTLRTTHDAMRNTKLASNPTADEDNDGLTNVEESRLGTSTSTEDFDQDGVADGYDTDGDQIPDKAEVEGFAYAGETWYLDPNGVDTNSDKIADAQECSYDENAGLSCPDTDGDGTPDAFDRDNDGDQVPDGMDLSPNVTHATKFDEEHPFELMLDGLTSDRPTFVEFQLRPTNPDHLRYAFNVLDWPSPDTEGQVQDEDDCTFFDVEHSPECGGTAGSGSTAMTPDDNGDMRLVPMLELTMQDTTEYLPAQEQLQRYGISVQRLDENHKAAYVPLQLTTEKQSDRRVAFAGKMLYEPGTAGMQAAHQARLVWVVQALVDNVCVEQDADGKCTKEVDNQMQVVHTYDDTWTLTGLSVREDHGVDMAIAYEDPAVDQNLDDDAPLTILATGLDYSFLAGRDCDAVRANDSSCITDGRRDITISEIHRRFNRTTNGGVSPLKRWGLPDTLRVVTRTYRHVDAALMTTAMTDSASILDGAFTSHWSAGNPISPTLLFAREERFRAANLDLEGNGSTVQWSGDRLTMDLDAGTGLPVQVHAGLNWAPYQYDAAAGKWSSYPMDEYWRELERRVSAETARFSDPDTIKAGKELAAQLYYLSLHRGLSNLIGLRTARGFGIELDAEDKAFSASDSALEKAAKSVTQFAKNQTVSAVNRTAFARIKNKPAFFDYLGRTKYQMTVGTEVKTSFTRLKDVQIAKLKQAVGKQSLAVRLSGIGTVVSTALALPAAGLMFYGQRTGNEKALIAGIAIALAASIYLDLVTPALGVSVAAQSIRKSGGSTAIAVKSVLGGRSEIIGTTRAANVVGLIISIGIVWGTFIYEAVDNDLEPGTIAFNTAIAAAIAATLIAIVLFVISSSVVGTIIVSVLGFIDLLLLLLCHTGVDDLETENGCFGITSEVTKVLADYMYSGGPTIALDRDDLIRMGQLTHALRDPDLGFEAGNAIKFTAPAASRIWHTQPDDVGAIDSDFYSASALRRNTLRFELAQAKRKLNASKDTMRNDWTNVQRYQTIHYEIYYPPNPTPVEKELRLYRGETRESLRTEFITLTAGIDEKTPLYFNMGYAILSYDCWFEVCDGSAITGNNAKNLSSNLIFDVFPATLDEFYALDWDDQFASQRDHDGDGVLSTAYGGGDPNDSIDGCDGGLCWDTDGDGLSDRYELEQRQAGTILAPTAADTDGDGLTDREEILHRTDPNTADSDGDGLSDADELAGWTFTYAPGKTTRVTSEPLAFDTDDDGLSDQAEKLLHERDPEAFPYHPRVRNPNALAYFGAVSDRDGVVAPGRAGLVYTATVQNALNEPLYARGTLTTTVPAVLNSSNNPSLQTQDFELPAGHAITVTRALATDAGAGSQTAAVGNLAQATLRDSARLTTSLGDTRVEKGFPIVIDDDPPTSTVTVSPYVVPGGTRIIGGDAGDPTSQVDFVEVSIDGGPWQRATGAGTWAYAWDVPDQGDRYTIRVRATDVVGNVQATPTKFEVTVDDEAPVLDTRQTAGWVLRAHRNVDDRWTVSLDGDVSDFEAGVRSVLVRLEPNGTGFRPATLEFAGATADWQIEYALSAQDDAGQPLTDPTGAYTATVVAIDRAFDVGNRVSETIPIHIDNRPPTVDVAGFDRTNSQSGTTVVTRTTILTRTDLTVAGTVTDTGAAGVGQVEVSFTPRDVTEILAEPLLQLPLDEPSGATTFDDRAVGQHDGICLEGRCPEAGVVGAVGTAVEFDGSTQFEEQYIEVPTLDVPETDYTAILRFDTTCADCGLFSVDKGIRGQLGHDRDVYLQAGNVCADIADTAGSTDTICSAGTDYADGNWHMVAQTIGAGGHRLYVDGELVASSTVITSQFADQTGLNVGFSPAATTQFFTGTIDDVTVFDGALSAPQIAKLGRFWQSIEPDNLSAPTSGWQYDGDALATALGGIEGEYQLDLTATDAAGNRNNRRLNWGRWRGEIDTLAPRVTMTVRYSGVGETARTHYEGVAVDDHLSEERFSFPCTVEQADRHYDPDDPSQLVRLTPSCSVSGFRQAPTFLRACDEFGRCAAAYPAQYQAYWTEFDWRNQRAGRLMRVPIGGGNDDVQTLQTDLVRPHGVTLDTSEDKLYWATFGTGGNTGTIHRSDLHGSNVEEVLTGLPVPSLENATTPSRRAKERFGLAVDPNANMIYWTETATGRIRRALLDGTGVETLITMSNLPDTGDGSLHWIALDLVNGKLYWAQSPFGIYAEEIWRADLDGSNPEKLIEDRPFIDGLALDPNNNTLYWTQGYPNSSGNPDRGAIWKANLDGSSPAVVRGDLAPTGDLTVEPAAGRFYRIAVPFESSPHLRQTDVDGTDDSRLLPLRTTPGGDPLPPVEGWPQGITARRIPGRTLTTTDLGVSLDADYDLAIDGATRHQTMTVTNNGPLDARDVSVEYYAPAGAMQAVSAPSDCTISNSRVVTCTIDTLLAGASRSFGIDLNVTGTSGSVEAIATLRGSTPADYLDTNDVADSTFYGAPPRPSGPPAGTERRIFTIDDTTTSPISKVQSLSMSTIIDDAGTGRGIAVDVARNFIYWSDRDAGTIWQANFDGSGRTTLVTGLTQPRGLAFDAAGDHLYVAEADAVTRIDLTDPSTTESVLNDVSARHLAYDPLRQWLFWDQDGSIYGADLQTGFRHTVYDTPYSISGLTVNPYDGLVYWSHYRYFGAIHQVRMDGTAPDVFMEDVRTPLELFFDGYTDTLYWFDYAQCNFRYTHRLRRAGIDSRWATTVACGFYLPQAGTLGYDELPATPTPTPTDTPTITPTPSNTPTPTDTPTPTNTPTPVPDGGIYDQIYWSDTDPSIERSDRSGGTADEVYTTTKSVIDGLAMDTENQQLYWIEGGFDPGLVSLHRSDADGSSATVLRAGINGASALALDVPNGYAYWTDDLAGAIKRVNLDGTNPVTLTTGLTDLIDIALDRNAGTMFWLSTDNSGFTYALMRADLDGSNVVTLTTGITNTASLALDTVNRRLYWNSQQPDTTHTIHRAGYTADGMSIGGVQEILTGLETVDALSVELDDAKLYWVEAPSTGDEIHRADLDGANAETLTINGLNSNLIELVAVSAYIPPAPTATPTPTATGTPTPTPTLSPTATATPVPADGQTDQIYWSEPATPEVNRVDGSGGIAVQVVTGTTSSQIPALDLDMKNEKLYWAEALSGAGSDAVSRADLDGASPEMPLSALNSVRGVAVDPTTEYVYWTDDDAGTVNRTNFDGTGTTTLVSGQSLPGDLELDIGAGHLYWLTDAGGDATLRRADLDGSNVLTVTDHLSGTIDVALDPGTGAVYWHAAGAILRGSLTDDGQLVDREDLVTGLPALGGLALDRDDDRLYWAEATSPGAIWRANLDGSGATQLSIDGLGDAPAAIAAAYPYTEPASQTLPPDLGTVDTDIITPTDEAVLTATVPISVSGSAASQDYVREVTLSVDGMPLYTQTWPMSTTVDSTWATNWVPSGTPGDTVRHSLRADLLDWAGNTDVATATVSVEIPVPPAEKSPPEHTIPLLDSVIITPTNGAMLPTNNIDVSGAAFAQNFLQTLTVTADGAPIYTDNWADGTITDTRWSTTWTPSDGTYVLDATATDWAGRTQTDTHPITVTVDTAPPSIGIAPTVLTMTHQLSTTGEVPLGGPVDAGVGAGVQVHIDGTAWRSAAYTGTSWRFPFLRGDDGTTHSVTAMVTDAAGRSAQATENVVVDVVPPAPVTATLGYLDGSGTTVPITPGGTVHVSAPTLVLDWTASSDGSGAVAYRVGWTTSPTPTLAALHAPSGTRHDEQTVGDREVRFAHVVTLDAYGNRRTQTYGPIYVDGPATPDFTAFDPGGLNRDTPYHGWMTSGASQIGADREISRTTTIGTTPNGIQRFFLTWDGAALRMAWAGADWNTDGDLFVYLDTAAGGTTEAYNPYTGTATIGLPAPGGQQLAAEYLLWIEDDQTATLLRWNGSTWIDERTLTNNQFQISSPQSLITDVRLPFGWLGITNPSTRELGLAALASEENRLRLWATMPDKNPLNSELVVNPLARDHNLDDVDLTQAYRWPALNSGTRPNEGRFADSDLRVEVTAEPAGVEVGYLNSDLLDLLTPGTRLDADGDGVIDVDLPIDQDGAALADGQTVTYTIRYANRGTAPAPDVTLTARTFDALSFAGGNTQTVNLGDIGPGVTGTRQIVASVDAAGGESAELTAVLDDGTHSEYDWFWVQHDVDTQSPTNVAIVSPLDYAQPFTNTVTGTAADPSGVASITLEIDAQPGSTTTITCPGAGSAGVWRCLWNAGTLASVDSFTLRVRATDSFGNVSGWSAPVTLRADTVSPTVSLDAATESALHDGLMSADERLLAGEVSDDVQARDAVICLDQPFGDECITTLARPGTDPAGAWSYDLSAVVSGDGVSQTLALYGRDGAGNRSAPLTRTYLVDTVAPVVTVTQQSSAMMASNAPSPVAQGQPVLAGRVTDGVDVDALVVRVIPPSGEPYWEPAERNGESWEFSPEFATTGTHTLFIEAYDEAGNARIEGPFDVLVTELAPETVYLPFVARNVAPPLPDLVVRDLSVESDTVQVVVENRGDRAVTNEFWVDVYIDPEPAPTEVNQIWPDLADEGLVWGVTGDALPLAPGQTLTLTVGDVYYRPAMSTLDGPIGAGTPVYAQVDSANANTDYGAVLETHERDGGGYNNVAGPVQSVSTLSIVIPEQSVDPTREPDLPRR